MVSATAASASVALGTAGCATVPYVVGQEGQGRITVPLAGMAGGEALVESASTPAPVYVRRRPNGEYTALLLRCTHRGCEPAPATDRLECPCHGSEFNFDGDVLQGPATRPLIQYETRIEGTTLVIELEGP